MDIEWLDSDIAEARRANRWLDRMPRFRMTTTPGRWAWNVALRLAELTPWRSAARLPVVLSKRTVHAACQPIDVRIVQPAQRPGRGLIVEFHGGGWTIGNARMSDRRNAEIALATGMAVVAVDYRLAVHHRLQEQVDDCERALLWAIDQGRREFSAEKVLVLAESAGAHLALLALLRLRDSGRIAEVGAAQLAFGLYDFAGSPAVRAASEDLLVLHGPTIRHVLRDVTPGLSDAERRSPRYSPLFADMHGLPPALIVVGDRDVLLDENIALAERWRAASGAADLIVAPESPHGFLGKGTSIARKTRDCMNAWLVRHA